MHNLMALKVCEILKEGLRRGRVLRNGGEDEAVYMNFLIETSYCFVLQTELDGSSPESYGYSKEEGPQN